MIVLKRGNILRMPSRSADGGDQSRASKAFKAIEGRDAGLLGSVRNPWEPIFAFDEATTAQIARSQGAAFKLAISDPFDVFDMERLAMLWDDEQLAAGPMQVEEGTSISVAVGPPKGRILTIWCTDANVSVKVEAIVRPEFVGDIAKEIAAQQQKDDDKESPFMAAFREFMSVQMKVGIAAVVVGGFVLYFWLRK